MSKLYYLNSPTRCWLRVARDRVSMAEFHFNHGRHCEAQAWLNLAKEALRLAFESAGEPWHGFAAIGYESAAGIMPPFTAQIISAEFGVAAAHHDHGGDAA